MQKSEKAYLRSAIISLCSLLVLLVVAILAYGQLSYGWFSSSSHVEASGMSIVVSTDSFELAVNNAPSYSSAVVDYMNTHEGYHKTATETTGADTAFFCNMTKDGPDLEYATIEPGAYGRILFDIVPKNDDDYVFDINLTLEGLQLVDEVLSEVEDEEVLTLLKGHILLFKTVTTVDGVNHYSDRIIDGVISYDTSEHSSDAEIIEGKKHYHVVIYWIWALSFAQMLLSYGDENLNIKPIFDNDEVGNTSRNELMNYISGNDGELANKSIEFFSPSNGIDFSNFSTEHKRGNYFIDLSNRYNNGDQMIGESIKYLIVEITVNVAN